MSNIITERVGSMPIIVDFLYKINLIKTIDTLLPSLRTNNARLSHGKTCFVMILYLLCRPHIFYRVEEWVANTLYLKTIFPNIKPEHFNDDRIGDTFKALHQVGIRNLFSHQSLNIIKEFELSTEQVHCDFTNFTVYGQYNRETKMDTIKQALSSYKQEWKVEKVFARLKGPLQVVPIFLQLPEHIEALMFLLMTCAQIFTLMDREAEKTLAKKDEKLAGLFPNKIKTPRPKAEMMLDVFRNIALVFRVDNGNIDIDISALNELQGKIIEITNVNPIGFNNDLIKQRLNTEEIRILIKKKFNKRVDFNMLL